MRTRVKFNFSDRAVIVHASKQTYVSQHDAPLRPSLCRSILCHR